MGKPARKRKTPAPRRRATKQCMHGESTMGDDGDGWWHRCDDCNELLPIGPSNDDSPHVQLETRAAELEETEHWEPDNVITHERWGFEDHDGQPIDDDELYLTEPAYLAGYLSAEIESHDAREIRDATAWAWRIDRPLAEQLAETAPDDAAAAAQDARIDAGTAALIADLDAKGPAWDALNDAFDAEDADLQAGGPALTTAEVAAYLDPPLTVTIDSDGIPAAQINGLCEAPPLFTPDEAEALADDLLLGADAARQAARDGYYHEPAMVVELLVGEDFADFDNTDARWDATTQAVRDKHVGPLAFVELLVGPEPEQGVEFEVDSVACTAPHDGECQPAAWDDGPMVCVVPLRVPISDLLVDPDPDPPTDPATKFAAQAYAHVGPVTRDAEPDCRDEDGPEVERIMAEMEGTNG